MNVSSTRLQPPDPLSEPPPRPIHRPTVPPSLGELFRWTVQIPGTDQVESSRVEWRRLEKRRRDDEDTRKRSQLRSNETRRAGGPKGETGTERERQIAAKGLLSVSSSRNFNWEFARRASYVFTRANLYTPISLSRSSSSSSSVFQFGKQRKFLRNIEQLSKK